MIVDEVAVFKDDFDLCTGVVGDVDDRRDVLADVIPGAAENLADVDDHVELLAAIG